MLDCPPFQDKAVDVTSLPQPKSSLKTSNVCVTDLFEKQ